MGTLARLAHPIRFGAFELDLHAQELRKHGLKVKLQGQPIEVLAMLLERPGELVTREELQKKLWPEDTFVDFEHSINAAVKRLREALSDSADHPRYIETLARRGYRFIATVEPHHPLTPSSERKGANVDSPPALASGQIEVNSPPGSGGGQGVVAVGLIPEPPSPTSPQITTGGFTRRAVAAVVQGALEAHRARTRWRRLAVAGIAAAGLALGFAALVGLNVGNLRDRLVGAGLVPARGRPPGAPLPKIESIAVLPLENLSGDKEQEYFADGMTEELITNLGKISALRVISRTSVMRYKGTKKPLPEIARELNVDAIVEGTVQRSGNRLRITANLMHAPSDRHLWADSYASDLQDVLVLQGEVARAIAEEVRFKLTPQEQTRLSTTRPVNPEAYEAYLRGRYFWSRARLADCVRSFEQAIEREPTFAPAYAGQAYCYASLGFSQSPQEVFPKAKAAAIKALEMNDALAEAHVALAMVKELFDWDWPGVEAESKRAIELNPSSSDARWLYSGHLAAMGRFEEAIAESKQARDLDPLSPNANSEVGWVYLHARRYEEAIVHYRKAVELDPSSGWAPGQMPWCFTLKGDYTRAFAEYEKIGMPDGDPFLGYLYAVSGRGNEALQVAHRLERLSNTRYVSPFAVAIPYAGLGDKDKAYYWLNKAYEERAVSMFQLKTTPWFDSLRSDPRFQDLLRRMNFPKEQ